MIILLKCKCGRKHHMMVLGELKPAILSNNHTLFKKLRTKKKFSKKDIRLFVEMWNKANPEEMQLIIEEKKIK